MPIFVRIRLYVHETFVMDVKQGDGFFNVIELVTHTHFPLLICELIELRQKLFHQAHLAPNGLFQSEASASRATVDPVPCASGDYQGNHHTISKPARNDRIN